MNPCILYECGEAFFYMSTNNNECWKQLYACMSAVRHLPNSAYYTVSVIAFRGTNRVTLRVPMAAYEGPGRIAPPQAPRSLEKSRSCVRGHLK
jgi:hypothetical protein